MVKKQPELQEVAPNDYVNDLKFSDKNFELAQRIVQQKAEVVKWDNGYDIDLMAVAGFRHESQLKTKKAAIEEASKLLASELESGSLVLADDFEFQHGIKAKN